MKQEGRHIDFYAAQAHERLAHSVAAQRLTRLALRYRWAPVGSGVMPDSEVQHLVTYLFGDASGAEAVERIDRHIDHLPGLGGLGLVADARARYAGVETSEASGGQLVCSVG